MDLCETVTMYRAKDGKMFESKEEAEAHSLTMERHTIINDIVGSFADTLDDVEDEEYYNTQRGIFGKFHKRLVDFLAENFEEIKNVS